MANFFTEVYDKCKKCGKGTFYERPLYAYQMVENEDNKLSRLSIQVGVQIVCLNCGEVHDTINKENQNTLIVSSPHDPNITRKKYKIE